MTYWTILLQTKSDRIFKSTESCLNIINQKAENGVNTTEVPYEGPFNKSVCLGTNLVNTHSTNNNNNNAEISFTIVWVLFQNSSLGINLVNTHWTNNTNKEMSKNCSVLFQGDQCRHTAESLKDKYPEADRPSLIQAAQYCKDKQNDKAIETLKVSGPCSIYCSFVWRPN